MMIHFWRKTHFGLTYHFSLYLEGQTSVHPEVFRSDDHNGTSFKAVWWSISEKNTFWAKTSLFFVFRGQTQCTLRFSGVMITMVQVSKLYNDPFSEKNTHFGLKYHFSLYLEGQTQCTLRFSGHDDPSGTGFKAVWWSVSEKTHFGLKHHFSLYLEDAKLSAPWGFQVWWSQWYKFQSCMMICFWENTFWAKTSLFISI